MPAKSAARRLHGLTALITGAASGIGRATAESFHEHGARTVLVDVDAPSLEALAMQLGDPATFVVADLGVASAPGDVVARAEQEAGPVDVLVNNAGVSSKTPFREVETDEWDRVFAVNVRAAVVLAERVANRMTQRRSGCILNVSSISGRGGGPPQSVYGITKGTLLGWTREMAVTLAPYGVRVNAVMPGVIDTPMVRQDIARSRDADGSELRRWIREAVPARRIGTPKEVAKVLEFLASPDGVSITGALVPVDGGFLAV